MRLGADVSSVSFRTTGVHSRKEQSSSFSGTGVSDALHGSKGSLPAQSIMANQPVGKQTDLQSDWFLTGAAAPASGSEGS